MYLLIECIQLIHTNLLVELSDCNSQIDHEKMYDGKNDYDFNDVKGLKVLSVEISSNSVRSDCIPPLVSQ